MPTEPVFTTMTCSVMVAPASTSGSVMSLPISVHAPPLTEICLSMVIDGVSPVKFALSCAETDWVSPYASDAVPVTVAVSD